MVSLSVCALFAHTESDTKYRLILTKNQIILL